MSALTTALDSFPVSGSSPDGTSIASFRASDAFISDMAVHGLRISPDIPVPSMPSITIPEFFIHRLATIEQKASFQVDISSVLKPAR